MYNGKMFCGRMDEIKKNIEERNKEFDKRLDAAEKELARIGEDLTRFSDSLDDALTVEKVDHPAGFRIPPKP